MSIAPLARRAQCATCLRPQSTCICRWITRTLHEVEALILQHPREVARAKGTARLLHLSLPRSRLVVGEQFAPAQLQALVLSPWPEGASASEVRQALLLYPDTPQGPALGLLCSEPWRAGQTLAPSEVRLIVLDGTWRESRKMLYLNPLLQSLPRLALSELPGSRYLIRKAQRAQQLSTLEATCAALSQLEGSPGNFQPLLNAFDGFVSQQSAYVGTMTRPNSRQRGG